MLVVCRIVPNTRSPAKTTHDVPGGKGGVRSLAGKPWSIPVPTFLSSPPPSKRQTAQYGIADCLGANRSAHGAPESSDNEEPENNAQCEDHAGNGRTRLRIHHYRHQGHECQRSQHDSGEAASPLYRPPIRRPWVQSGKNTCLVSRMEDAGRPGSRGLTRQRCQT